MLCLVLKIAAALKTINISDSPHLEHLKTNCDPTIHFYDHDAELINLVAIFRHGDRAPLKIKNSEWRTKLCVSCDSRTCKTQNCADGMITLKGFEQSKKLGAFIKNTYMNKISNLKTISAYKSQLPRSLTTVMGVFEGLEMTNIPVKEETSLVNSQFVTSMRNYMLKEHKQNESQPKWFEYAQFDDIVTSFCSDTPFLCKDLICNHDRISKAYKNQLESFLNSMRLIKNSFITSGISFGDFGEFFKKEIQKENSISLVSGHDSTIIKLLQGLSVPIEFIPPYSAVVFVEVWRSADNTKFVRVLYEGKILKIGLYDEELVELNNFVQYLDMFNIPNSKLKHMNKLGKSIYRSKQEMKTIVEKTKEAYEPIITEINSNETIRKKFIISLFTSLEPTQYLLNGLSFLKSTLLDYKSKRQYLFGWFSSSKQEEMIQIKKTVEDENGNLVVHTIECPKSGKGNCKTISKQKVDSRIEKKQNTPKTYELVKKESNEAASSPVEAKTEKKSQSEQKSAKVKKESEEILKIVNNEKCDVEEQSKCTKCEAKQQSSCGCTAGNELKKRETPCEKKQTPCEMLNKPKCSSGCSKCEANEPRVISSFDTLPGSETIFKTSGCNVISGPVPPPIFGPKPTCNSQPMPEPRIIKPCAQATCPFAQGYDSMAQVNGIFN